MNQAYDFNNFQQDALTRPRDKAWENWQKWPTIGTMVQGFIRDVFFKADDTEKGKDQRCLTLEQPDGTLINVGIKHIDFVLAKTDNLRLNDPVTIVYAKDIPPTVKSNSPTKQFEFYGKNLPENANEKTVAQLEAEDRKTAEEDAAKSDAVYNGTAPVAAVVETAAPAPVNTVVGGSDLPFVKPTPAAPTPAAAPVAAAAAPAVPATPVAPAAPTA